MIATSLVMVATSLVMVATYLVMVATSLVMVGTPEALWGGVIKTTVAQQCSGAMEIQKYHLRTDGQTYRLTDLRTDMSRCLKMIKALRYSEPLESHGNVMNSYLNLNICWHQQHDLLLCNNYSGQP